MKIIDLTGQRFGRLVVLERAESRGGATYWRCQCDCGNIREVYAADLRSGKHKSCGCAKHDNKASLVHGGVGTRLYRIWLGMKQRCLNERNRDFPLYGGRGITVCEAWRTSFPAFRDWAMQNAYANNLTIDRIDVNGNYEPSNCRWVTMAEQNQNRRCCKTYKNEDREGA